jgi:hypothetical protein
MRENDEDAAGALARVLLTALEAAGEEVRRAVLVRMLEDEDLRDEVEAALLWEERKDGGRSPLRDLLPSLGIKPGE